MDPERANAASSSSNNSPRGGSRYRDEDLPAYEETPLIPKVTDGRQQVYSILNRFILAYLIVDRLPNFPPHTTIQPTSTSKHASPSTLATLRACGN
jgi:hypothetical protein